MTADRGSDADGGPDPGESRPEPAEEEWLDEEWGDPVGRSATAAFRVRAKLAVAGAVAPVGTVIAAVAVARAFDLPGIVVAYAVLGAPVLSLGSIGIVLWQSDLLFAFPDWFPAPEWLSRPPTLADRLPDHHKAAFSHETLAREEVSETDERLAAWLAYFVVYLAALPLWGVLWLVLGATL